MASFLPCPELLAIMTPAYGPCREFAAACGAAARWHPGSGQVPRGFVGALGTLAEVELVLLIAEPGDPLPGERHGGSTANEFVEDTCAYTFAQLQRGTDLFHRNLRGILNSCWPGLDLRQQLHKAWISETYLCSARVEGGTVPASSWRACASDYLAPQLRLLADRVIVALGSKAQQRTTGFSGIHRAGAVAPPGCNFAGVRASWDAIPGYLAERRST